MSLKKKKIAAFLGVFIFVICLLILTNYSWLKKIVIQNNYSKDNGFELAVSLVSSFNEWNRKGDMTGNGYERTLSQIMNIIDGDDINSDEVYSRIAEITKSNMFLKVGTQKNKDTDKIMIDQCIILPKLEVLYLTFNTFAWDKNKVIELSLVDQDGKVISSEVDFKLRRDGLLIRNTENYFWGINIDAYSELRLHVKIMSKSGLKESEYEIVLYDN